MRRLYIGGLALDECVLASVIDALNAGLEVRLLQWATRPVDDEKGRRALERMMSLGVLLIYMVRVVGDLFLLRIYSLQILRSKLA